jgi:Zn-dependent protease
MDIQGLIIFIPLLLVAMTIHEASHAFMSYALGDHTAKWEGRLSLNPFAHIDPIFTVLVPAVMIAFGIPPILAAKPVPFDPARVKFAEFGAALVALAGPISNLLLAIVAGLVMRVMSPGVAYEIVEFFLRLNVSLAVFNLVPWPPLDGSRVLYAFAPEPLQRVMRQIESFGIAGLFMFIFLAWSFVSPFVATVQSWIIGALV